MHTQDNADKIARLFAELFELITEQQRGVIPSPRTSPEQALLTVEEAAQRLHIGRTRMFGLLKSGEIDSVQIGRSRRIRPEAVERFAKNLQSGQHN